MTSRDVVNVVQWRVRSAWREAPDPKPRKIKVGHCGTLDPLAEGVLVLGVGPAVRLMPYMHHHPKRYLGKFQLGASSETGDLEKGLTLHDQLPIPTEQQLLAACQSLTGAIQQVPPAYSAIWVDGKRAYDRVRSGEDVQMPTRNVVIHDLKLTRYDYPHMELDITCGSGTYIRTLGIDVARAVGSMAVMSHLQRVSVGQFPIESTVDVETLREQPLEPLLMPAALATTHLPKLRVDDDQSKRLMNGLCVDGSPDLVDRDDRFCESPDEGEVAAISASDNLLAIVRRKPRGWCPIRVFPTTMLPPS